MDYELHKEASDLIDLTCKNLSQNKEKWKEFLDTASRVYDVPSFYNQVLIYAQRPNATICAPLSEWHKKNRSIKENIESIWQFVLSDRGRNVNDFYDIGDTFIIPRKNEKIQQDLSDLTTQWELKDKNREAVISALSDSYGPVRGENFKEQIESVVENAVERHFNHLESVLSKSYKDYIESQEYKDYKDNNSELLKASLIYVISTRCGEKTDEYDSENFSVISKISEVDFKISGRDFNEISRKILGTIEQTIKEEDRREQNGQKTAAFQGEEQYSLFSVGNSLSSRSHDRSGGDNIGEISDSAGALPSESQAGYIPPVDREREAVGTSAGDRRRSGEHERTYNATNVGEESNTGKSQEYGSAEVGGPDDELQRLSNRNSNERTYLSGRFIGRDGGSGTSGDKGGRHLPGTYAGRENAVGRAYRRNRGITENTEIKDNAENTENKDNTYNTENTLNTENMLSGHNLSNFRITDDNHSLGGSLKEKYNFNIGAIKTLKLIESENRLATPEEQVILSRYTGWGSIPEAFDNDKPDWNKEYKELKSLLTEDEYQSACASALNAHYTSPTVVKAVYEVIKNMGFSKGNILEPAMGAGNFFGLLPESMKESKLYGVELDSVTGRIAKQLYQNANITVSGYEKTSFPNNIFDVAVGNVPFGDYKVPDTKYDNLNMKINDYFFAKTLDQVRPGGVIAFVTSKDTLDQANPTVRKYLAQRAELLGAIRLPNSAFMDNAGTGITADIIFLQKRERQIDIEPDWVHLDKTEEGIPVNSYFAYNPQMMLGKMVMDKSRYGNVNDTACIPDETDKRKLEDQLNKAIKNIQGNFIEKTKKSIGNNNGLDYIPADPRVQNFTYTLVDEELYYRDNSIMTKPKMSMKETMRAKGLVQMRDCVRTLIDYQLNGNKEEDIKDKQKELNDLYDLYISNFGIINNKENGKAFKDDSSYYLLCSLENMDEHKNAHKTDIFYKKTIKQKRVITSVETAAEALAVSIAEKAKVDIPFMSKLTGSDGKQIISELQGAIFQNPEKKEIEDKFAGYETADEYLSGNIREKLIAATKAAEEAHLNGDTSYDINVKALEAAMPKKLTAAEIDVRLGAAWVNPEYIQDFIKDTLDTPSILMNSDIKVLYDSKSAEWFIEGKNSDPINFKSNVTYGTSRMNAYKIIEETLNLRDVKVFDTEIDEDGKKKRVINKRETTLAQQKQEIIKQAFKDWIFKDQTRRDGLVEKYNKLFNSIKPREYDGRNLEFSGINPEIVLQEHQRKAIARIMYGGNTLLAHSVGAGKTFEMIAAAMESKRLGLCQKSLFVVPNHLTEQTATEFMRLYPSANILVATKEMFSAKNRNKFCARIATGDYDAVIIGHSQFEKIPISKERQNRMLKEEIYKVAVDINDHRRKKAEKFSIKQLERTRKNLESRLMKLRSDKRKDDAITFEELGVDRLFVDEAHYFKNLFIETKMRNVAGIPQTEAQKSSDLYLKCRYMDETTGGKGIVFATGTPVSNSMTELYTMMKYLQHDKLEKHEIGVFDAWASSFGETVTSIELAPEGTGYRPRTRFAKFYNLPELMSIFKESADIQTKDKLNFTVPKANFNTIVAKPSQYQKDMIEKLSERAEAVHEKQVEPWEDNMLKITTDGRKIGLDQRFINPILPDYEGSKVNMCTDNIYKIWDVTKKNKSAQLLFCDISTPKSDGRFNVYDDIKDKLIKKGIPKNEIAYIHDADTEEQKDELFAKVRNGQIRVLMGSTTKMGAGTNVQSKLIALHDLDCPWRPADLEQRVGRIIRQGNENKEVNIYRYVTDASFDSYLFQTVENKQKFISQIMTSKSPLRTCEDADENVLSYAEIKALCAGDEKIREKMNLDIDVAKLRLLKCEYQNTIYNLEDKLNKTLPIDMEQSRRKIAHYEADILQVGNTRTKEFSSMTVMGKTFSGKSEKTNAGEAIIAVCKDTANKLSMSSIDIGEYRGFKMSLSFNASNSEYVLTLKNNEYHKVSLGDSASGNMTRIENALNGITEKLEAEKLNLSSLDKQVDNIKGELMRPFAREDELAAKSTRLNKLNIDLNLDQIEREYIDNEDSYENENVSGNIIKEEKNQCIREAKDVLGKNAIITNAQNGKTYDGIIVAASDNYIIQATTSNNGVIHELEKIPYLTGNKNDEVIIKYDNTGYGEVIDKTLEENSEEMVI